MTISEIKEAILSHKDFYGGDIPQVDEIKRAKTKKDLKKILNDYAAHLELIATDAQSHHDGFVKELGLHMIY